MINRRSESILENKADYIPIHKRTNQELERRQQKIQDLKEQLTSAQEEKEQQELIDIESKYVHKPGQRHDQKAFESSYRDKVDRWQSKRQSFQGESQVNLASTQKLAISKGSQRIVEGNFQNLGTRHGRKNSVEVSLDAQAKLDSLKNKYQSASKTNQLNSQTQSHVSSR